MLVGIHQPHYLPWLRYFEKIARCDVFIVLDNIQFTKNGWQNRNKIKSPQGTTLLTAPVLVKLGDSLDQVQLNNNTAWRRKHWESIRQCYGTAPYFAEHADFLADAYGRDWDRLNDLNRHMLVYFVAALGIKTRIEYASELQVPGAATERLVNLVKRVGGNAYYTGAFAVGAYLDPEAFAAAGIALRVQEWQAPTYPQLHGPFIPDLSVLDLMMNVGPGALDVLKAGGQWT